MVRLPYLDVRNRLRAQDGFIAACPSPVDPASLAESNWRFCGRPVSRALDLRAGLSVNESNVGRATPARRSLGEGGQELPALLLLANRASDWPWSTFGRFVSIGLYEPDWGEAEPKSLVGWQGGGE